MKKTILFTLLAIFACLSIIQAQNTKEDARQEKKDAEKAYNELLYQQAKLAIDNKKFVLEADQVMFKYGNTAFVSSNTNFVGLDGDNAVVQVAFNIPASGPNGLGGITVDGKASNIKTKTDKKGNIILSMNVMGVGISAQINITLYNGSNSAMVDISPNFSSNRFRLSGKIIPLSQSTVFKGRSL